MRTNSVVFVYSLKKDNKVQFISEVKKQLCEKFQCTIDELPINYGYDKECGLLHYIEKDDIASYSLLYIDGNFWAGCGGKLRMFNDKLVYQGCWRYFSSTRKVDRGLGSRNFVFEHISKQQILEAKDLGCEYYIISYNLSNYRMYKIQKNIQIPKVWGINHEFSEFKEPIFFNGVYQWLLMKKI